MLSIYLGDSKIFHVQTFSVSSTGSESSINPVSGYFSLIRINDNTVLIDNSTSVVISSNDVYYSLEPSSNVVAGFCRYVFEIYFSGGYKESYVSYVEILETGA